MEFGDVVFVQRQALRVSYAPIGDAATFYLAGRGIRNRYPQGVTDRARKRWPGESVPTDVGNVPGGYKMAPITAPARVRVRLFPLRQGGVIVGRTRMLEGRTLPSGASSLDDDGGPQWVTERVVPVLQVALARATGPMRIVHAIAPDVSLWVPQLEGVA